MDVSTAAGRQRQAESSMRSQAAQILATLGEAYRKSAGLLICPPEFRDDLVGALTRCVTNFTFLSIFTRMVDDLSREGNLPRAELRELPEGLLLQGGFGQLDTATLVAIALTPGGVTIATDLVNRTGPWKDESPDEVGPWVEVAILKEYGVPKA